MRAKTFTQFIGESLDLAYYGESKSGNTRFWFTPESDMQEVLGEGLWQFRIQDSDLDLGLQVLESLESILGTQLHPVIQSRGVAASFIWFRPARGLSDEEVRKAENVLDDRWSSMHLLPDVFLSNPNGVLEIINGAGKWLTADQAVQLVEWLNSKVDRDPAWRRDKLDPDYLEKLVAKVKELPNWPEDLTDWALGDW
jgi:hypothetical protein